MMRVPLLTCLITAAGLAGAGAGEAVRVTLWAAEVPAGMVADRQGSSDAAWFAAVRAEVAAGRSEEAALLLVSGRQGERMTIGSVREMIYAAEEDPESHRFAKPISPAELMSVRVLPPFLPPVPMAFETRNVGEWIEVEVGTGSGPRVRSLRLNAEWVRQDGEDVSLEYGQDDGGKWAISFPRFVTRKIQAQVDCLIGMWTLAGMVDPWREEAKPGTKSLVFVRVESIVLEE